MANIVKKVNRGVPSVERSQKFNQDDAVEGDILMVKQSLGKPASHITIATGDELAFRLNVHQTVFPPRKVGEHFSDLDYDNLALGQDYIDETGALFQLGANETLEFDDDIPVSDIQLVTVSGEFEVTVI